MPFLFDTPFFRYNPYFLPCLCSSVVSLVGFVIGYLCLPETCPNVNGYQTIPDLSLQEGQSLENRQSLQEGSGVTSSEPEDVVIDDQTQTSLLQQLDQTDSDITINAASDSQNVFEEHDPQTRPSLLQKLESGIGLKAAACAAVYCVLAFVSIIWYEVFPLWAIASPPIGLGFTSIKIGIVMSTLGIVSLIAQLFVYPYIASKHTPLKLFRTPLPFLILITCAIPLVSASVEVLGGFLWPVLIGLLGLRTLSEAIAFTSIMILISNSAKPGHLGAVNGVAQTAAAFARTIGPALGGTIWAWSSQNGMGFPMNHILIFLFIVVMFVILLVQSWVFLKEERKICAGSEA